MAINFRSLLDMSSRAQVKYARVKFKGYFSRQQTYYGVLRSRILLSLDLHGKLSRLL